MPTQLAHEALNLALNYTEKTVDWAKSKPGICQSVVSRLESPITKTLDLAATKKILKIGDQVLTSVDGHIDSAINSKYYKGGEAFARSTYSNRIVPATNTVTTTVKTTTSRVTTPVVNVYTTALAFADRQVESYLPDAEASDRHAPLSLTSVSVKATRRAVKKVGAVKTGVVMRIGRTNKAVRAAVRGAMEQTRPTNIKKNAVAAYKTTFATADGVIDAYLPGAKDDGLVVKGPVTLVTKLSKRSTKHTIAGVKALATAVRNSPTTFKKAVRGAVAALRLQVERVQNMGLTIKYKAYDTFTPYIEAAMSRSLAVVKATDQMLLKRQLTARVRNFAVDKYQVILAPYVDKYLPKPKPVSTKAVRISLAAEAKPVPVESPMSVQSDSSDLIEVAAAGEAEAEPKKKKKSRGRKKTETEPASPPKETEAEKPAGADDDAYC
mmetsp:Transcript_35946/g.91880  ORF Transcript_35946/g.91880 Transcript_35946/m.91880 type:complete len:438 (-) Transcript_35946:355-1668(-)|eukprot:CAMPEP_0174916032 /NCGR_PEP_ID=MMETSP1355-20121228/1516_1 /TAXON_ID=464990 /ORGANISM="Hemiselmis tepida, Strain CCMP443" /LENGTH=437 /DNA_ID=CAMNT_0016160993 /DNA_START=84 /DNA_END=1397 /DNA_ORIENTATION=+